MRAGGRRAQPGPAPALLLLALLLAGCAGVARDGVSRDAALALGRFDLLPARAALRGIVIGAPHGGSDTGTERVARMLAESVGAPTLIALGYSKRETGDARLNVNRPTEGAHLSPRDEPQTARARHVWEEYQRLLLDAAAGPLDLYVELHSNDRAANADTVEVATVGLTLAHAEQIKGAWYRARSALPAATARVEMRIEPVDRIYWGAGGAKAHGSLRLARRAMHIEIPVAVTRLANRRDAPYALVLIDVVRMAITLTRPG